MAKVSPGSAEYNPDPELEQGPMEKRGCTDILCCLIFLASWIALILVAGYGFANGNPKILLYPMDSSNNSCGYSPGFESYPYLYYPVPFTGYLNITVCLQKCPVGTETVLACKPNLNVTSCNVNGTTSLFTSVLDTVIGGGSVTDTNLKYAVFAYNSTGFARRFCLPGAKLYSKLSSLSKGLVSGSGDRVSQWIADLETTWTIILSCIGIALVLGFIWMILMRCCVGILTWLSIIAFLVAIAILGWVFYQRAINLEADSNNNGQNTTDDDNSNVDQIKALKVVAYICWGVDGIFVIIILCIFKSIRLAIAIVKAASDFVKDTPTALLVPIYTVIYLGLWYAFWIVVAIYLYSVGEAHTGGDSPLASVTWNQTTRRMLYFWLFELFWNNAFIIAVGHFTLASAVCLWYFSQGTDSGPHRVVSRSLYRAFRYHLGSLAFGSFILAVVQFIKFMLALLQVSFFPTSLCMYVSKIQKQVEKYQPKQSRVIKFVLACLQCYVSCFERFIKFLNKNAYIQIALTGKNFCTAAKDALLMIMANPVRFGLVAGIGGIFMFIGKAFIVIATVLIGYLIITKADYYSSRLYSPVFPCLAFFIVSYCIAELFMLVYGMAANTILHCFCLDEELQKRKNCPARHCPETLKNFIDEQRKQR